LDVIYIIEDKCGRRRDVIITIDITNICTEDLILCKWVEYLEKLAREFIHDICPKKLVIIKDVKRKCREQPPKWVPFPCKTVTTVIKKRPIIHEPECEVIVERECECIPECIRRPCIPKKQLIIRYETEKPWKCGDHDELVIEPEHKHHDFNKRRGNVDFNDHVWRPCCTGKKSCCGGSSHDQSQSSHFH